MKFLKLTLAFFALFISAAQAQVGVDAGPFNGGTVTNPITAPGFSPLAQVIAASGSAQTLSPISLAGSVYNITLTGNTVFTLSSSGVPSGSQQVVTAYLNQDATAGRSPTFSSNVVWQNNVAPTLNTAAGYYDVVQFSTVNGGTTYTGLLIGSQLAAPTTPGVPAGVGTLAGNTTVLISANPLIALPAVTGYTIYRGTTPGGESGTPIATNVSLPHLDTGLTNTTTYYYKIAGVNSLGTGGQSAEVNATPSTTAYGHYAAFTAGGFIYTPYNAAFNPLAQAFTYESYVSPNTATPATAYALSGQWFQGTLSESATLFYLDTTGKLGTSWAISSSTFGTCLSSTVPGFISTVPLWVRADVTPTTGACTFYTGGSASSPVWAQLGTTITSGTTGAVQSLSGSAVTDFVVGSAYNHPTLGFVGNMYQNLLIINGTTITNPISGASGTTDSVGMFTFTSSGVTYN